MINLANKIIVVGGVAGGASIAARVRRLDENADIKMFEKGPNISFSNCSLPYYLGNVIEDINDLYVISSEKFHNQNNVNVFTNCEVIDVDYKNHEALVKDLLQKKIKKYKYDYLFLSPGAYPIIPENIVGVNKSKVFTIRNVEDVKQITSYCNKKQVHNIAVIGGGYIGLETAENLKLAGYKVSLIEEQNQVLSNNIDYDFAQIVQKELLDNDVNVILNDRLQKITDEEIILSSGKQIQNDLVIMAVGIKPNTQLARKIGINLNKNGAIKVDANYETNLKDIYAVGDAIEVVNGITQEPMQLSLAWPAQIEARRAVDHIYHKDIYDHNFIGASVIHLFQQNIATVGLTECQLKNRQIDYETITVVVPYRLKIMPHSNPVDLKILFSVPEGKILGAQAIGVDAVDRYIDVISTLIKQNCNIYDAANAELCYSPWVSCAKNGINMAGLAGSNLLNHEYQKVSPLCLRKILQQEEALIIDCREEDEFKTKGHVINTVNIPLSEFRKRLEEIPKNKNIYIYCASGHRSYFMTKALMNLGYTQVFNLGSFIEICQLEYFQDQITHRKPIVTKYCFDLH